MPSLKSQPNSTDSDDEYEEDLVKLEGKKKHLTPDDMVIPDSGSDTIEDTPVDKEKDNPAVQHVSDAIESNGEIDNEITPPPEQEDDEVIWPEFRFQEQEEADIPSEEPMESEYITSEIIENLGEDSNLDDGSEADLDELNTEDTGIKSEPLLHDDVFGVSGTAVDESEAYLGGTVGLYYLRGLLCHQRMNLDDGIRYLGKSLELAVEMDLFEYVVKSQIQLAAICLKRYRIHGYRKDYNSSLQYSENLIQIAKELELDELWTEALLLRAILRKIARDVYGARDDLNQARAMAKSTGQESIQVLIEHERQEVRRLVARARRKKLQDDDNGVSMMDDAIEAIPAIFDESLKLEVSRESLEISVELSRLVIMNLSSGLPLYTYSFDGAVDQKDDLVYGFLSALSHLAAEVMDSPGMIRSITHEGSTVMMEHKGKYMAALFASREDFRARQSVQKFLKEFLRLLPDMSFGEVVTSEYRATADEILQSIFKAYLKPVD